MKIFLMKINPILKWPGGKSKILDRIEEKFNSIPNKKVTFFDLFGGGGSVTIKAHENFEKVVYNDINSELVNVFLVIKNNLNQLIKALENHKKRHSTDYYYQVRDIDKGIEYENLSNIDKAARFLYLNKTCYNGLYRVNSKGEFNVPIGSYSNPKIYDADDLRKFSNIMKSITIYNQDYSKILPKAKKGDVVYIDPPYDKVNPQSFVNYNKFGFNNLDQTRLAKEIKKLTNKGVYVIFSNSSTENINSLYSDYLSKSSILKVKMTIGSTKNSRKEVEEVLADNFSFIDGTISV